MNGSLNFCPLEAFPELRAAVLGDGCPLASVSPPPCAIFPSTCVAQCRAFVCKFRAPPRRFCFQMLPSTLTWPLSPLPPPPHRQAFQTGDMSSIRDMLASSSSLVNYQRRLGDGTTALMAASFHGDLETVRYLLSLGAKVSAVDGGERNAAVLASTRGNRECFVELQRWAKRQGGRTAGEGEEKSSDYVYDLYCFEPGNTGGQSEDHMEVAHAGCLDEKSPAEAAGSGHTVSLPFACRGHQRMHRPIFGCVCPGIVVEH